MVFKKVVSWFFRFIGRCRFNFYSFSGSYAANIHQTDGPLEARRMTFPPRDKTATAESFQLLQNLDHITTG